FEGLPGPVGTPVVDVHDLVVAACRTKGLGDPRMERFEVLAFVEHRQNDRQRLGLVAHWLAPGSSSVASQWTTSCDGSQGHGPPSPAPPQGARRRPRRPRNSKAPSVNQTLPSSREGRPDRAYHTGHRRPEFSLTLTERLCLGILKPTG